MQASISQYVQDELISSTVRILNLSPSEFRVTDRNLLSKNPKCSICDIVLKTEVLYSIEYLMELWERVSQKDPKFVFKNTGVTVSLSCYIQPPIKPETHINLKEFNTLNVNEVLIIGVSDIVAIKPSRRGVLTKCVIRRCYKTSSFTLEFITFGPENELEYNSLLDIIYTKREKLTRVTMESCVDSQRKRLSSYGGLRSIKYRSTKLRDSVVRDSLRPATICRRVGKRGYGVFFERWFIVCFFLATVVVGYAVFKELYKESYKPVL